MTNQSGMDSSNEAMAKLKESGVAVAAPMSRDDVPNNGMHASIFAKVWGDAGGGDAGRIALAEYAYALGRRDAAAIRSVEVQQPPNYKLALQTICSIPLDGPNNMVAYNMKKVAAEALSDTSHIGEAGKTETPRTEAVVAAHTYNNGEGNCWYLSACNELAGLARQLERELAASKAMAADTGIVQELPPFVLGNRKVRNPAHAAALLRYEIKELQAGALVDNGTGQTLELVASYIEHLAALSRPNAPVCPTCKGNDANAPCAYPSEGKPGCLRDARLATVLQGEREAPIASIRFDPAGHDEVMWHTQNPPSGWLVVHLDCDDIVEQAAQIVERANSAYLDKTGKKAISHAIRSLKGQARASSAAQKPGIDHVAEPSTKAIDTRLKIAIAALGEIRAYAHDYNNLMKPGRIFEMADDAIIEIERTK